MKTRKLVSIGSTGIKGRSFFFLLISKKGKHVSISRDWAQQHVGRRERGKEESQGPTPALLRICGDWKVKGLWAKQEGPSLQRPLHWLRVRAAVHSCLEGSLQVLEGKTEGV